MIKIILPELGKKPIGGFKIILDYANYLSEKGEIVTIFYSAYVSRLRQTKIISISRRIRGLIRYLDGIIRGYSCKHWFNLSPNITETLVFSPASIKIQENDILIATSATTQPYIEKHNNKKYYFIQGYELWNCSETDLKKTYLSSCKNIVVSTWLYKTLETYGAKSTIITNSYDLAIFKINNPIKSRSPYIISCMYHPSIEKGFCDAYQAILLVRQIYPNIKLTIFGAQIPDIKFPDWCTFIYRPTQIQLVGIYNSSAIYVAASKNEGWGLTIGEAMLCGCAVACTDNRGYREMAFHGKTALLSKVGDIKGLAENMITLISDGKLRCALASNSSIEMKKFDTNTSREKFYDCILSD